MHATAAIARKFEKLAARGLAYEAQDIQREMQRALNDTVRAVRDLRECKVDVDYADFLKGLIDEASNADAPLMKTIDEGGLHAEHIDLTEVRALLAKVKA